MKVGYRKEKILLELVLGGGVMVTLGMLNISKGKIDWLGYLLLAVGVIYTVLVIYKYIKKYLLITEKSIRLTGLPTKEIELADIKKIRKTFNGYKIKSNQKTIHIVESNIDKLQLSDFKKYMEELQQKIKTRD